MKLTKEEVLSKSVHWQLTNIKEYTDYLVYSKYWSVRRYIARHGTDTHRDILVSDKHRRVRRYVAVYGNDTHRDILVNDEDWEVREQVAIYGNDTHRTILVHDEDVDIRNIAEEYMGSTYHKLATNFGTYNGILSLWVWEDRYEIESGCYNTDNLEEWFNKCESRLDIDIATKYTKIMKDIIGGIQNETD